MALGVKKLPASAGDIRDIGLISGSGRSPGGGHGNPLQYSCLENPTDKGAWWATVHGVAKSWTWLKRFVTAQHRAYQPNAEFGWECECREDISFQWSGFHSWQPQLKGQSYVFLRKEAGNIWINELAQSLIQKWKAEAVGHRGLRLQLPEAKGFLPFQPD